MNNFFYGIAVVFIFAFGVGYLGPTMVSSKSDLGVILGFAVFPLTIMIEYYLCRHWYKTFKEKK